MTSIRCVVRSAALICTLAELPAVAAGQVSGLAGFRAAAPIMFGRAELNTTASADRIGSSVGPRTALSLESVLRLPMGSGGMWLGTAIEGSPDADSLVVRPLMRAGAWRSFSSVGVSVEASTHVARVGGLIMPPTVTPARVTKGGVQDTIPGDTTPTRNAMWSELEGRFTWLRGRARFEAIAGGRPSVGQFAPAAWASLRGTYALTSRLALVAAGGSDPARVALGIPASRFASIALRVLPGSTSPSVSDPHALPPFAVHQVSVGSYHVTYIALAATSVELSGDFNGWKAIALSRGEHGVWEATIPLGAGTYHVNIRVNGGQWFAPSGLPEAHDDFNGTVGVFVVP